MVRPNGFAMAIEDEALPIFALATPLFNGGNKSAETLNIVKIVNLLQGNTKIIR